MRRTRITAIIMAVLMVVSLLPVQAMAQGNPFTRTLFVDPNCPNLYGNSYPVDDPFTYRLDANEFTRDGYTLIGWAVSANGDVEYQNNETFTVEKDGMTVYAVWQKEGSDCTITFHTNREQLTIDPITVEIGSTCELPGIEYSVSYNYLAGWAVSETGELKYEGGSIITVTRDMDLYAVWRQSLIDNILPKADREMLYFGGMHWRTIGSSEDGKKRLLILYSPIETDISVSNMTWNATKECCETIFADNFSVLEQSLVCSTVKEDDPEIGPFSSANIWYPGTKLFLLSAPEAYTYFADNDDRGSDWWWLRSPLKSNDSYVGVVKQGYIDNSGEDITHTDGCRPAFVINMESVLFMDGNPSSRHLTILDPARSDFTASISGKTAVTAVAGSTVSISYNGAKTGEKQYISAMLCDGSDGVIGYASEYPSNTGSGIWELPLPSDLPSGNYILKVFSEQQNGALTTDYASPMISISLTVEAAPTPEKVATPTFSPEGGSYTETQRVTINCNTEDADIYYTINGSDPKSGGTKYSEPITVSESTTIKAIAVKTGMTDSDIASAEYTINIPKPHDHTYTSKVTKKPTCTEKGVRTYTCECGESYEEDIRPLGHHYVADITKDPSTSEEGVKTFTCTRCGDTYTEAIPKLNGDLSLCEKSGGNYELRVSKKLKTGGSITLVPVFAENRVLNRRVVWESSDPDVATVTQGGKVSALSAGETIIRVHSEEDPGLSAYCIIYVTGPATAVTLSRKSYSFGTGESVNLDAGILPFTASQDVKWSTSNTAVVVVCDDEGNELHGTETVTKKITGKTYDVSSLKSVRIKAVGAGSAKVTATAADGSGKKATCTFTVGKPVPEFTVAGKGGAASITAGKSLGMIVNWGGKTLTPKNAGVKWSISANGGAYAPAIATISSKGVLTGITAGKVTVIATSIANPSKKASAEITVNKPATSTGKKVAGIIFTDTDNLKNGLVTGKSFTVKTKQTLSGNGKAASGAVAWYSSDPSVATVSRKGVVKAVAPGRVKITAVARDAEDISTAPSASVTFDVYAKVKSLKIDRTKLTLGTQEGAQYGLISIAAITPDNARDKSVKWTAGNGNVRLAVVSEGAEPSTGNFADEGASVTTGDDEALAVMGVKPGVVKLTGITNDGSRKKVSCTVTVRGEVTGLKLKTSAGKGGVNNVTISDDSVSENRIYTGTMKHGGSMKLTPVVDINYLTGTPSTKLQKKTYKVYKKYTDTSVSYRSSDTSVATVDKKGKISIKRDAASGRSATIHVASADGKLKAEYRITVK